MAPPLFAHLHSSPLVVRRRSSADWRSLSSNHRELRPPQAAGGVAPAAVAGLEPVEIIDVAEERKLLVQCLREARRRIAWRSEVADLHSFRRALSFGCRALHFSGHGVPGRVIFEDRKGEAQFVSQAELKDLLLAGGAERGHVHGSAEPNALSSSSNSSSSSEDESVLSQEVERGWVALSAPPQVPVRLVFVSACHSESVAEAFVSVGVPHVVVVSKEDKMLDKKAMEFAKAFYTALFAGHSVRRAFQIGHVQADISIASDSGSSSFKLLGNGNHSEPLFRDVADGVFVDNSPPLPTNECDAVAEVFVGRSLEVHQAYKSLVEGARLVSITGEPGVGKTEIALQCANYATERHVFKHIFFLRLDDDEHDHAGQFNRPPLPQDANVLLSKLAKALGVGSVDSNEALAEQMRLRCTDGVFLLIIDGCNRAVRQNPSFRAVVGMLLRRVSSLSVMLTGDGKLGAMDGVGEKIVSVECLPPSDAALLFTLRAPRKIKTHEMGGSADLAAFAEHPVIKALTGHPRTICAVSQFLENKDMELDQHEFLDYIIPSVLAGLCKGKFDQRTVCSFASNHHHSDDGDRTTAGHTELFVHSHAHHHHVHVRHGTPPLPELGLRRMKGVVSQPNVFAPPPFGLSAHSLSESGDGEHGGAATDKRQSLFSSLSESNLKGSLSSPTSQQELCCLKLVDHVKSTGMSEDGCFVWAHAIVKNVHVDDGNYSAGVVHRLVEIRQMPLDWVAPQISRYFASKLKADAVNRPLSLRSIDFLSKSSLIWGCGKAPVQIGRTVDLDMFAAFWKWFDPLVACIEYSTLWPFTQPRLLHGFLSKGVCVSMLQHAPAGTFLLRFSETRRRCFVIAYVHDDGCVQFVPVTCKPEGGWYVALQEDETGVTFSTIQDLILSVNVLKYLFPQTPKETAFHLDAAARS